MSFEPVNAPFYAQAGALPLGAQPVYGIHPQTGMPMQSNPFNANQGMMPNMPGIQPKIDPRDFQTPNITTEGSAFSFSVEKDNGSVSIPAEIDVSDMEKEDKKRKRSSKKASEPASSTPMVTGDVIPPSNNQDIIDTPTAYTYMETTNMLRDALGQIDALNAELMQEFTAVRHNRTMKNKYNVLVGLSENVGSLIGNKISAIREINSSISKANDLDYKKAKDIKAAQATLDDDKYIADMYKSFISNPNMNAPMPIMPDIDPSMFGSGVVRANIPGTYTPGMNVDTSYLNFQSNLTPEENAWRYENNPSVQQVLVFDDATGNKFFQYMDLSTGQVIPNMPVYDEIILEDTTIDRDHKIAKNNNINQTFPLIIINEGPQSKY